MANQKEKQFEADLKANQDASDKLDKELNAPTSESKMNAPVITEAEAAKLEAKKAAAKLKHDELVSRKARKKEILEEYGGTRSNVPLNHPEFWNL